MNTQKIWLTWEKSNVIWSKVNLTWSQFFILIEIGEALQGGGGAGGILLDSKKVWKSVDQTLKEKGFCEEKRNKFLEIVVEVNGKKINKEIEAEQHKKQVSVKDIYNVFSLVNPDIKIRVDNIR
jgi:hypothetical protein